MKGKATKWVMYAAYRVVRTLFPALLLLATLLAGAVILAPKPETNCCSGLHRDVREAQP
jgi:hypothetical protein